MKMELTHQRTRLGLCGTRRLLLAGFLDCSIHLARSSETPALIERPNADVGPTQVSVAIWFVDINSIDSAQQTFTADVFVVLRWKDPRLAHTGNGITHYPLDQIWHPRVAIVNETNSVNHRLPESVLTLIAYRFAVDSQLPRLPYMTRLDAFIFTSTLLLFFSLIEVLVTTILDNNQQTARAKKIDRYCRAIFPVIFAIASIAIFVKPRD